MNKFSPYNALLYTDRSTAALELAKVLTSAVLESIELGELVSKVRSIESSTQIQTAAVDAEFRIYVNADWWSGLKAEQKKAVALHEMFHPTLRHFTRRTAANFKDASVWNIAGDMVINTLVKLYGGDVSMGVLPPSDYSGPLLTEALLDEAKRARGADGSSMRGCGVSSGELGDTHDDGSAPAKEAVTKKTLDRMADAAKARGAGRIAKAWAPSQVACKIPDWRKFLARTYATLANSKRGAVISTYAKPRARNGVLLPRYVGADPTVALVIDSSGSMGQQERNEVVKLAVSLTKTYPGIRTYIVTHTDRVEFSAWANARNMLKLATQACQFSGGTCAQPAYDEVKKKCGRVDVMIHMTDCYIETPWPSPPSKKLVVIDWGGGRGVAVPTGTAVVAMGK